MKAFIVLSCFVAAAVGSILEPPELRALRRNPLFPNGRIVGGVDTDISQIPYQVALEYEGQHFCGGSIISDSYILTAAHCMIAPASRITIRAGSSHRNTGGVVHKSAELSKHPYYNSKNLDYDVAIIKLTTKLQFSDKIKPVQLVDSEPASGYFLVSGWGMTKEDGQVSETLKSVYIPIITRQKCNTAYASFNIRISERMICAYALYKDSCQGDSGGPAVVDGRIGGIVSWGVGCARPNFPGVYTNVANKDINSFIRKVAQI